MQKLNLILIDKDLQGYATVEQYCKKNSCYDIQLRWLNGSTSAPNKLQLQNIDCILLSYYEEDTSAMDMLAYIDQDKKTASNDLSIPVILISSIR